MRALHLQIAALAVSASTLGLISQVNADQINPGQSFSKASAPAFSSQTALPAGTIVPFQKTILVSIADGSSQGSDNGNVSPGTQTIQAPVAGKAVIETVSLYRSGAISNSTIQPFINVNYGNYNAFALPPCPGSTASYAGVTFTGKFYAYAGSRILLNIYRNSTVGAESITAVVSGYTITN